MKYLRIILILIFLSFIKVNASSIAVSNWDDLSSALNANFDEIILRKDMDFIPTSTIKIKNKTVRIVPEKNQTIYIRKETFTNELFIIDNKSNVVFGSSNGSIDISSMVNDKNNKSFIYVNNSNFTTKNITMRANNTPKVKGSCIAIRNSNVIINDSIFLGNTAKFGGAVYVYESNSNLEIKDSIFNNNTSLNSGGALYTYGKVYINDSKFQGNVAYTHGGAMTIRGETAINGGLITNNVATTESGGGIRVNGKLYLSGTTIKHNAANNHGGGIDYRPGKIVDNGNAISENYSGINVVNIYPDSDSRNNVDWKRDKTLNLEKIDVELLKTFRKDGTNGIPSFTAGTQGAMVVDNFLLITIWTNNNSPSIVHVFDKNTLKLIKTNTIKTKKNKYNLGHMNDFGYDSSTGYIYAYTYQKDKEGNPIAVKFKVNSKGALTDFNYFTVPIAFSGIDYDNDHDQFILMSGNRIYIYDNEFNFIKSFNTPTNLTTQGISYYKDHIYFSCYEAGYETAYQSTFNLKEKGSNLIYVYDLNGNLIKTLYIPNTDIQGEIESTVIQDNGEMLLTYNYNGVSILKSKYLTEVKSIDIVELPIKKRYKKGERINLDGLVLKLTFNDESSITTSDINNFLITGFDTYSKGKQTITLNYKGQQIEYDVEMIKSLNNRSLGANSIKAVKNYIIIVIVLISLTIISILSLSKDDKIL